MSVSARLSAKQQQVLIGCAIAAGFWAASGVAALFSPTGDASDIGSVWFYIIESTHAVAETGMLVALLGLWRGARWEGRSANAAFLVAAAATTLLAFLTYLSVGVTAAGLPRETGEDVVSLAFLVSLLGTLIGFIWIGIAVIRSGILPAAVGWLLVAHPVLLAGLLFIYPLGIGIGALWAAIGWLVATRWLPQRT